MNVNLLNKGRLTIHSAVEDPRGRNRNTPSPAFMACRIDACAHRPSW